MKTLFAAIGATVCLAAPLSAETWTLNNDASRLAFGSVKKDTAGEVHSFANLSGTVDGSGNAAIEIDLTSVQTNIEIRDDRIKEHVFNGAATANISAELDMADMQTLAVGDTSLVDFEGVLSLLGRDVPLEAEMFVTRLSTTQVLVTTADMVFLGVEDLGLTAGVDTLMELAKLPGITRTTPVTVRFVFEADEQKAEATEATTTVVASAEMAGDAKAGKQVFKKCRACHATAAGKNGAGPSLHGIFGAQAAQVEGFKYSKAMAASNVVWTAETLAGFLAKPRDYIEGTSMAFTGLKKEKDITNLLAYLAEETQ